jgi:hypothetical protein
MVVANFYNKKNNIVSLSGLELEELVEALERFGEMVLTTTFTTRVTSRLVPLPF